MKGFQITPVAVIHNDYKEKFGIPRQSGLAEVESRLVFLREYSDPAAFRSLEEFSHLWLIWGFSLCKRDTWRPTVRPPKLGGNVRMGVFATRSPFRPNPLGLSSVELKGLEFDGEGRAVLLVTGADLADGTPVYDVKPYLPYTDCHPEAKAAWADPALHPVLQVAFAPGQRERIPSQKREALVQVLSQDPRPAYQEDPLREYAFSFGERQIRFRVEGELLTVTAVE